jgi:hypothetical protein
VRIWRSEVRRDRPCGFVEAVGQVSSVALNRFGMSCPSREGARGRAQRGGRRRYQGAQGDTGTSSLHHLSPSRPLTCRSVGYGYPVRCDGPGGDRRPDQGCVDQASREEFMSLAAVEVADKNRVSGHEPGSLPYFPATPAEGSESEVLDICPHIGPLRVVGARFQQSQGASLRVHAGAREGGAGLRPDDTSVTGE